MSLLITPGCQVLPSSWRNLPYQPLCTEPSHTLRVRCLATATLQKCRYFRLRVTPPSSRSCITAVLQPSSASQQAHANGADTAQTAVPPLLGRPVGTSLGTLVLYSILAAATLVASSFDSPPELSLILALETIYVALHLAPLLPLALPSLPIDEPFLHAYTVPAYFATEIWAFALLYHMQLAPSWLLGGHAMLHVAIFLTSALAPAWTLEMNLERAKRQVSQPLHLPTAALRLLLNTTNFLDMAAHILYFYSAATALHHQQGIGTAFCTLILGLAASYACVQWLPQLQHRWAGAAAAARASAAALDAADLSGVTVLVTGGSSGAGREVAKLLFEHGATVIITSPSLQRAEAARAHILANARRRATGAGSHDKQQQQQQQHQEHGYAADVVAMQLDLADLGSVRRLAQDVQTRFPRLHVLICNAGVSYWDYSRKHSPSPTTSWHTLLAAPFHSYGWRCRRTAEGIDATFAVNHLGHFLLTKLLMPTLASTTAAEHSSAASQSSGHSTAVPEPAARHAEGHASTHTGAAAAADVATSSSHKPLPPARVVFVTSHAYWWWSYPKGIQVSSLASGRDHGAEHSYTPWQSYGQSKLAMVLAAQSFARRQRNKGMPNIPVVALHPGTAPTSVSRHMGVAGSIMNAGLALTGCSVASMARSIAAAAVDPALADTPFTYRTGMRPAQLMGPHATDEYLAEELWQLSEQLAGDSSSSQGLVHHGRQAAELD